MKRVSVSDVRQVLEEYFPLYELPKSDNKLLQTNLLFDLGFDSMDIADLSDAVQVKCDVSLTYNNDKTDVFSCNPTIENFMELFE